MRIRRAHLGDAPFVRARIWDAVEASPGLVAHKGEDALAAGEARYWAAWDPDAHPAFVALDEADEPLGALVLKPEERDGVRGLRFGIGVVLAARRRGVGRALVAQAVTFGEAAPGIGYVSLLVDPTNHAARALYAAAGFEDRGEIDGAILMMRPHTERVTRQA